MTGESIRTRRHFLLKLLTTAAGVGIVRRVDAQLTSFDLTLRRDKNLPSTLGLNDCVLGKLFSGAGSLSDPGTVLCDTLELPFRNELKEISCIKPGSYAGFVRTEPTAEGVALGWRIQLEGTKQLAIQIHTGNTTDNTRGCILVGNRATTACTLQGGTSAPARQQLRSLYGDNNKRPIRLVVLN
jgi:hypothetical protein